MPVERSALARRAAGATLDCRHRHVRLRRYRAPASPSARPCRRRCRACRGRRVALAPSTRSSRRTLRSWSQKNLASERRARSTRSLPAAMVLPPSGVTLLATNKKRGAGVPSGLRQEKYFWCVRIAVASTSGGRPRAAVGRNRRRSTPSAPPATRPAPSPRRAAPGSSLTVSPSALASLCESFGDDLPPARPVEHDMRGFQLGEVVGGVVDRNLARCQEPWPRVARPTGTSPSGSGNTSPSNRQITD